MYFSHDQSMLSAHCIEHIINIQVHFYHIEATFNNRKNRYGVYVVNNESWQGVLSKYKTRRYTNVISNINSNKQNNLNTSNSDNVIVNSNFDHISVQNDSPFNTLITL